MKIKRRMTCGQEVPAQVKVKGYHWEIAEGYNWGHWVKDKKEVKKRGEVRIVNEFKENC